MKIDRDKKYEGVGALEGLVIKHSANCWWDGDGPNGHTLAATDYQMARWLDAGHIQPVKETKIVRVEGVRVVMTRSGMECFEWPSPDPRIPFDTISKPFDAEFEVEA